jgi:hypothetical protein
MSPAAAALADKLKAHPEIDNPHALAKWLTDKGEAEAEPMEAWARFKASKEYEAYCAEAVAASAAGQLQRPQKPPVPKESNRSALSLAVRILEADGVPNDATRELPVIIIKEGMGNKVDRNFYSAELLRRVFPMFEGVKAYADHPSKSEEKDRPERSIRDIVGHYHSPRIVMVEGKTAIAATLKINDGASYDWAWNLVREAAAFAKKYPDKDLVGISINAYGASHQVEGEFGLINMVDDLSEVGSADIVTQAGAGGGFRLRESIRKILAREGVPQGGNVKELLQKHGDALSALRDKIKGEPEHEKAYGPALEELVSHHSELVKAHERLIGGEGKPPEKPAEPSTKPAAPPAPGDKPQEGQLLHLPEGKAGKPPELPKEEEAYKRVEADYKAGKLSEAERKIFELVAAKRHDLEVAANAKMVAGHIRESGIPEAYAADLVESCAGKSEDEVKTIVETRKALISPLLDNRGSGAGAGTGTASGSKTAGLAEKLAAAGVKLKA